MYEIRYWLKRFRWRRPNLFSAFTTFVILVCFCIVCFLFFGPMVLSGFMNTGWPLLLEFITIPIIVGGVNWVCWCYEF